MDRELSAPEKMDSEQPSTPTSNEPEPTQCEENTGLNVTNGNISQIPGLSPSLRTLSDYEKFRGRRVGVLDSDSEYVKLAKQGGHKGLLWHEESVTSSPHSYKPPDWFSTGSESNGEPSLIKSEHRRRNRVSQSREPPFGSDNMSAWERDQGNHKNNNTEDSETETPQKTEGSKFRRIVFDKRPVSVNMSKLLSFGYAGDVRSPTTTSDVSN